MKSFFAWTLALALLVVWAAPAVAQTSAIRVDVPFAFYAGKQLLPAGEYKVTVELEHMLARIIPVEGGPIAMAGLRPGDSRAAANLERGLLRFTKWGTRYMLSGVWRAGSADGNGVAGSLPPKEYVKTASIVDVPATR